MVRIAVCDDDGINVERINAYIFDYFNREKKECVVKIFLDGEQLLLSGWQFDIVFLDIEIGGINGIELAGKIRKLNIGANIVFVTDCLEYWHDAYGVHPFYFIEKPADHLEVEKVLGDYMEMERMRERGKIQFDSLDGIVIAKYSDIIYFYYESKKRIILKTVLGEYVIKENLCDIYSKLDERVFFMPHKCCIINMDFIDHTKKYDIFMINGDKLPLAQKKKKLFLEKVRNMLLHYD